MSDDDPYDAPRPAPTRPTSQPLGLSIPDTCRELGNISRVTLWRLVRDGKIRPVPARGRVLFPRHEILRFLGDAE